jgi:hypothetical protein
VISTGASSLQMLAPASASVGGAWLGAAGALLLGAAMGAARTVGAGLGGSFAGVWAGAPHAPEARASTEIQRTEGAARRFTRRASLRGQHGVKAELNRTAI